MMNRVAVFDSGAGGRYVADLLTGAGVDVNLTTHPGLFPFGDKSAAYLYALFLQDRRHTDRPVFCACNTMSLVLCAAGYEFERHQVIGTFPVLKADAPVLYGSKLCTELASAMCPDLKVRAVPHLIDAAERVYRGTMSHTEAEKIWLATVIDPQIQLGSTHLSYLANKLGIEGHVEPDYLNLWTNSGFGDISK